MITIGKDDDEKKENDETITMWCSLAKSIIKSNVENKNSLHININLLLSLWLCI